jgi:hypothetical protein
MPLAPPVTTATLPANSFMKSTPLCCAQRLQV